MYYIDNTDTTTPSQEVFAMFLEFTLTYSNALPERTTAQAP